MSRWHVIKKDTSDVPPLYEEVLCLGVKGSKFVAQRGSDGYYMCRKSETVKSIRAWQHIDPYDPEVEE